MSYSRFLFMPIALVMSCTAVDRHANVTAYRTDLALSIRPRVSAAPSGGTVEIEFTLTNNGPAAMAPCRYSSSFVHFWGLETRYAETRSGPIFDHDRCEIEMNIAPGEATRWQETIRVPTVVPGKAKLMAHVRLVDKTDCDRYGCYSTLVSASATDEFLVMAAAN